MERPFLNNLLSQEVMEKEYQSELPPTRHPFSLTDFRSCRSIRELKKPPDLPQKRVRRGEGASLLTTSSCPPPQQSPASRGSKIDLSVDQSFSKSSQRRRRHIRTLFRAPNTPPTFLLNPTALISFVFLILLPWFASASEITPSQPPHPPTSTPSVEVAPLPGIELSDSLDLSIHSQGSLNGAEEILDDVFDDDDDEDAEMESLDLDIRMDTLVLDRYSHPTRHEEQITDLVVSGIGLAYQDGIHTNFQKMIYSSTEHTLYVVGDDASLIKLDGKKMTLMDAYAVPALPRQPTYCQESQGCRQRKEINLLARTPGKNLIFYCALHYEESVRGINRPVITSCVVPDPNNLAEHVMMWDNGYYTSMDPHRPPVLVTPSDETAENAVTKGPHEPFLYIAGVTSNYLHLGRLQMPDFNGNIRWEGALFSPKRNVFINEPASVVMSFATESAVYFLLRESSTRLTSHHRQALTSQTVTRLVRVCRGDRGGLEGIAENFFGTMAKADLICHSQFHGDVRSRFAFPYAEAGHWDATSKRLYTVFSTGEAGPSGSAVCVYDLRTIERVFNGPVSGFNHPQNKASGHGETNIRKNPFPNICERFATGNLTAEEIALGQIGAHFLYRYNVISPLYGHAVAMSQTTTWKNVIGYQLPMVTNANYRTTVLWLTSTNHLTQMALYESRIVASDSMEPVLLNTCELRRIRVGRSDSVLEKLRGGPRTSRHMQWPLFYESVWDDEDDFRSLSSSNRRDDIKSLIKEGESIYVGTLHSVFRLPTDSCSTYGSEDECLASGDPHCGWNSQIYRCVSLLSSLGVNAPGFVPMVYLKSRPSCPALGRPRVGSQENGWTDWHPCSITDFHHPTDSKSAPVAEIKRSCMCRICLSETQCNFGEQQVSQCKVPGVWSPWSVWSPCEDKLRYRTRTCFNSLLGAEAPSSDCVGDEREEEFCLMHPIIPEELTPGGLRAEHASLVSSSGNGLTGGTYNLIGVLAIAFIVGICILLFILLIFERFCCRSRLLTIRRSPHSVTSTQLDFQMYSTPSPTERSITSDTSPRYNFLPSPPPPPPPHLTLNMEHVALVSQSPEADTSTTTGDVYDRLSETTHPGK